MALNKKVIVRTKLIDDEVCWLVRDVGWMVGYGSKGGNLSRNINGKWKHHFVRGLIKKSSTSSGGQGWWANHNGLMRLWELIRRDEPKYALGMTGFMHTFQGRKRISIDSEHEAMRKEFDALKNEVEILSKAIHALAHSTGGDTSVFSTKQRFKEKLKNGN